MADSSLTHRSISLPRLRVRAILACIFIGLLLVWHSGVIHEQLPDDVSRNREILDRADWMVTAFLIYCAVAFAFTFTKVTIRAERDVEVKRYLIGFSWSRYYTREEIGFLGTEYKKSDVLGKLINEDPEPAGTRYLYIVLKNGERIRIYRGANESYVSKLCDFLQTGLGLEVKRL